MSVTREQHRHMHALWRDAGVTERADRLALTSAAVGREITTSSDLTRDEASQLLTYMTQLSEAGLLGERTRAYLTRTP